MSDYPHFASPCIVRRRYIPDELTFLDEDFVYELKEDRILTAWEAIHPRTDLMGGLSVYYPKQGFKISKCYDSNRQLVHWYCDIIRFHYHSPAFPSYPLYYEDLLLDVVIKNDGQIRVLDTDELADAMEQGIVSPETSCLALRRMHDLLHHIYSGEFARLQQPVLDLEKKIHSGEAKPI